MPWRPPRPMSAFRYPSEHMISVITPSFNMLPYLRRCAASVRDQGASQVEHLVMDGGSTDGTADWLAAQRDLRHVSEKDNGMYDAINKGFDRAHGDIAAYLNCDEQYLPGTLEFVEEYFSQHPAVDLLFGGALLIRPDGSLISYRKPYRPRPVYILTDHLYVLTCAMFLRRGIIEKGFRFDTSFRANGDTDFVVRLLHAGCRAAVTPRYLSAFTMTGGNLSAGQTAAKEARRLFDRAPVWAQKTRRLLILARRLEKFLSGAYYQRWPLEYAVYAGEPGVRTVFRETKASFRWKSE